MVVNFHELYQKYASDIHRFAYWLCGNVQDAEDITSETFVRALTSTQEIQAETIKGYLLTIAKRLAFKKFRQKKRLTDLPVNLPAFDQPEQTVETKSRLQSTMTFLQSLPPTDRAAILMHVQEELSYHEIANMLGLSITAVKVKVYRTRIKLKEYQMKSENSTL